MKRLKGIYRHAWSSNHKLFFELNKILKKMHDAGIATMILKGAALTIQVYRNMAIRPMADMDILVKEDQAILADEVLKGAGWLSPANRRLTGDLKYRHSINYTNREGFEFDLHWHPIKDSSIVAGEKKYTDLFWESAVPITVVEERTLAPDSPEALFLVIIHGTWDNLESPIRWIADACYLIDAIRSKAEWKRFVELVCSYRVPMQIYRALSYLRDRFAASIPIDVLEDVRRMHTTFIDRMVFHCSMIKGADQRYSIATRIPGLVEYLRVSGDRGWPKLLAGFPAYAKYRMANKGIGDLWRHLNKRRESISSVGGCRRA